MLDTCRMSGAANREGAASQHDGSLQHEGSLHSVNKTAGDGTSETAMSTDNAEQSQRDNAGDRDHVAGSSQSPKPPSSPEPNCAICLGQLENKSFTDSCFHMFCFVCLQEWSKVKAECPLCKQPFKSIIHNVRSYNMYDQFYLEHRASPPQRPLNRWYWDRHAAFRLMLPFNVDHRYMRHRWDTSFHLRSHTHGSRSRPSDLEPSLMRPSRRGIRLQQSEGSDERDPFASSRHLVSTIDFRRRLYLNGYRVTGVRSSLRYRHISPEFFRNNPAQTHRLIPWLNRELNALLYGHESQVQFVLELIQDLIKRFAIDSEEFYQHVSPYIGRYTRHFMHEFLMFARSPYIMGVYDTKAIYQPSAQMISSSESSGEDSDVVVIDDDDAEEAGRPGDDDSGREAAGLLGRSQGNEPPSVRQEFSSSSEQTVATSQLRRMLDGVGSANSSTNSGWDSPTPGPSWDLGGASDSPVNVVDSSDSEASTVINAANQSSQEIANRGTADESDAGDEVIFVGYDKPWEERSPIQLSSGSDDESYSKFAKQLARSHKHRMAGSDSHQPQPRLSDRAWSPPGAYCRSRSPHKRSRSSREGSSYSIGHRNRSGSASSSHRQREKRHRKHRHSALEDSEQLDHLSSGSQAHGSKHHSHSRSHKKSRRERAEDEAKDVDQPRKRRHKKRHKKHRERSGSGQRSRRHQGSSSSHSRRDSCSTASSRERGSHRELGETCKKHPSGHKKSRLQAGREECRDRHRCAHASTSTSERSYDQINGSSSQVMDDSQIPSWNPLHIVLGNNHHHLQHHHQSEFHHTASYFSVSGVDIPSPWENLGGPGLIEPSASCTAPQIVACENSSQEPVLITSSDESDHDYRSTEQSADDNSGSDLTVAQTVVVPCSSHLNVPTEGINFSSPAAGGLRSSASLGLSGGENNDDEECIDVDSLSSSDKMSDTESEEILDVESVSEVEGESPSCVDRGIRGLEVANICAEAADMPVPVDLSNSAGQTTAPVPKPCGAGEEMILVKDVFMGVAHSSQRFCRQSSVASFGVALVSPDFSDSHCQPQDQSVNAEEANSMLMSCSQPSVNILEATCPSSCSRVRHSIETSSQDQRREELAQRPSHRGDEADKSCVKITSPTTAYSMTGRKAKKGGASHTMKQMDSEAAEDVALSCSDDGNLAVNEEDASEMDSEATSSHRTGSSNPASQHVSTSSPTELICDDAENEDDEAMACPSSSVPEVVSEKDDEEGMEMASMLPAVSCPPISEVNDHVLVDDRTTCSTSRECDLINDDKDMCDSSSDRDAPEIAESQTREDPASANMLSSTDFDLSSSSSSDELDTTESHGSLSSIVGVPSSSNIITVSTSSVVSRSQPFLLVQHQEHNLHTSNVRDFELSGFESIDADSSENNESIPSDVEDQVSASFSLQDVCEVDHSENNCLGNSLQATCEGEADSCSTDDELGAWVSNVHDADHHGDGDEPDGVSSSGVNSLEQRESCLQVGVQGRQAAEQGGEVPDAGAEDTECVSECDQVGADSWGHESCQWSDLDSEDDTESGVDSSGVDAGQYVSDRGETVDRATR